MSNCQKVIWQSMINIIQSYIDGETEDFESVVGKLEGALDASEINDPNLVNQWYDFWTPLEIRRAVKGNKLDKEDAIKDLLAMQKFLESKKNNFNSY